MRALITGANGFIAKNLIIRLKECNSFEIATFTRADDSQRLISLVKDADIIFHLAGENRPKSIESFEVNNVQLTQSLCDAVKLTGRKIPIIFTSSTQSGLDNPYGISKKTSEEILRHFSLRFLNPVSIFRLPGVFGKWCRPNYNSVVATFCNNIAGGIPVAVHDSERIISLVYVDDVVDSLIKVVGFESPTVQYVAVSPEYEISLGELAKQIQSFKDSRTTLVTESVGTGLIRCLYSTYLSYLSPAQFAYELPTHSDPRGMFVEMLKTADSGQFSFFTALPGVTRGGHYHHTKTEKFLVAQGEAVFKFRHLVTDEIIEIHSSGSKPEIVESIPGWAHDITNIGAENLIVLLWANEIFDRGLPDTISSPIN
ncbi:NAD-dependent epimerase/dehydratase family protein [Polynucleobacter sp. AP-Latsch-80-C2]|jgi:UDP-2-acetamido-2,6-beta-L-arabino-hexul-4-ose reductase|uniref:UDP-2-acetamido-2,6-beta-L-arabino-hexul-4-ose reductase n=1 Tax=Polynucleobacter sp. AP-Latsch-80-C2 TaxID=2576931 RepID=UPI001C0B957F|nr:NAD-dependent epimerase/dehydratase family protein [Polynucleobacter sp. AP-Latsch-80-C2]MBU3624562.1 SDR family oxidoreductase [Polynucleobacter sp. AP-Latsch-80-C2]